MARGRPAFSSCISALEEALVGLQRLVARCGSDVQCYRGSACDAPLHPFFRSGDDKCYQAVLRLRKRVEQGYDSILFSMRLDPLGLKAGIWEGEPPAGWLPLLSFQPSGRRRYTLAVSTLNQGCEGAVACGVMLPGATPRPDVELALKTRDLIAAMSGLTYGSSIRRVVKAILRTFFEQAIGAGSVLGQRVPMRARILVYRLPVLIPRCRGSNTCPFPQLAIIECSSSEELHRAYGIVARGTIESLEKLLEGHGRDRAYYMVRYAILDEHKPRMTLSVFGDHTLLENHVLRSTGGGCEMKTIALYRIVARVPSRT